MNNDRQMTKSLPAEAPPASAVPRLLLTVAETAEAIGVSRRQIYNLAGSAGLPTVKLGGRRLVRVTDLREWVAAQPVDAVGQGVDRSGTGN